MGKTIIDFKKNTITIKIMPNKDKDACKLAKRFFKLCRWMGQETLKERFKRMFDKLQRQKWLCGLKLIVGDKK